VGSRSPATEAPTVVLGAGYAGLATWHGVHRLARGRWPVVVVDRHPVHVLRTELYQVGAIAAHEGAVSRWALPLRTLLRGDSSSILTGDVTSIDLKRRTVRVDGAPLDYRELAICLGSVPAYYGIPGAVEHSFDVYRLSHAEKLGQALVESLGSRGAEGAPVRVLVVGGGSTGTEVAADLATVRWPRIVGRPCPRLTVLLVAGKVPLLAGLPEPLVRYARESLHRSGVLVDEGRNVREVQADCVTLDDGTVIPFDVCVWAAGVEPPALVSALKVPRGRGRRLAVDEHLELPGYPGVVAVGDVAEFVDPTTRAATPATAQAALAEAPVAAANLVARRLGGPLRPFRYRERGVIVSLGRTRASGSVGGLSLWGRPAALLKLAVQTGVRFAGPRGGRAPGL